MRALCIAALCLTFAASAWADPLTPGQPAGVHRAQHEGGTAMYLIGGAALAAAIAVGVSSGNGSGTVSMTTSPVTSTTTSTS
jgi:hypothetical protein